MFFRYIYFFLLFPAFDNAIAIACFWSRPEFINSAIFVDITFLLLPLDNGMTVPINCKICENIFYVKPYRIKSAKCCSRKCLWYFTKPIREPKRIAKLKNKVAHNSACKKMKCIKCKKSFSISPSRIGIKWYCSRACYFSSITKTKKKYKFVYIKGKKILEHRFVMENFLKRPLNTIEHVHHIDGDSFNNKIENLQVLDIIDHAKITAKERRH